MMQESFPFPLFPHCWFGIRKWQAYKYLLITPFVLPFSLLEKSASYFLWLPWHTSFFLRKNIHIKFQGTRTKTGHKHHQIKPRHSSDSIGHQFPMSSIHHPGQTLVFSKFPTSQEQWQGPFCRKNPPSRHRRFRYLDKPLDHVCNANSLHYPLLAMWKEYVVLTK